MWHAYCTDTDTVTIKSHHFKEEDKSRYVEVPDDMLESVKVTNFLRVVVEKQQPTGKWPRAKGLDWRETLQTGDIIDAKDTNNKWYESLVRYVYPESSERYGNCIIHYIGWKTGWDEIIDIYDKERLMRRNTRTIEQTYQSVLQTTKYLHLMQINLPRLY